MPNSKKLSVIGILLALVVVGGVWFFCHARVNQRYPNPTLQVNELGETFLWQNAEMTISDFEILPREEFLTAYNLDPSKLDSPNGEEKDVVFRVTLHNPSSQPVSVDLLSLMLLETEGYSSYTDLLGLFHQLNPDQSGAAELGPHETVSLWIPYTLYDFSFQPDDFETLESLPFSIVLTLYPVKTIVKLNW